MTQQRRGGNSVIYTKAQRSTKRSIFNANSFFLIQFFLIQFTDSNEVLRQQDISLDFWFKASVLLSSISLSNVKIIHFIITGHNITAINPYKAAEFNKKPT